MTKADRVHSTPPTNTSALPVDPTRRRFLTVAAVGSMVSAGTLAAAAFTPNDVPQAVTVASVSPALRAAIDRLAEVHTELEAASEAENAANDLFLVWVHSHPQPKSKKGKRRWIKQMGAYEREVLSADWQALIAAEQAFAAAQTAVAAIPISSPADLHAMAVCSAIYDEVELNRHNRAPIARVVAQEYFRLGKAVLA